MKSKRWMAIPLALALWAFPALARADHHEAGGVADEHRSDRAAERSNAQWDEDNEGKPDKPRAEDKGDADREERGKRDADAKKDKDAKHKKGKRETDEDEQETEQD